MALTQPVATAVTFLLVATVCTVILATTGQTVAAEAQVLSRIDLAGTRSITVLDSGGRAGLTVSAVDRISLLSGVEWVIGLGPAQDATNAQIEGGRPAPIRTLYGDLPGIVTATSWDRATGTALIGSEAQAVLGLDVPAGGLILGDRELVILGSFTADEPLAFLNRSGLTVYDTGGAIRSIQILARQPADVEPLARAVVMVLDPLDPSSVAVETSAALADLRTAVAGELGRYGRNLVSLVLSVGLVLVGLSVYGTVSARRRDFGRRRALGASRPTIVGLVIGQTLLAAAGGTVVGSIVGLLMIRRATGALPAPGFPVSIATLALLTATIAALPPAMIAAFRDPVRVLRVP
jgi:putative ABC transport system permease protein